MPKDFHKFKQIFNVKSTTLFLVGFLYQEFHSNYHNCI